MRLLCRHTLNALTVLSLLLCVACALLWLGSFVRPTPGEMVWQGRPRWLVQSQGGFAAVEHMDVPWPPPATSVYTVVSERGPVVPGFALLRVRVMRWTLGPSQRQNSHPPPTPSGPPVANATVWRLRCSYAPVCLALLVLPTLRFARHRLHRPAHRRAEGRCPACGYDLRATPDRCPECGAAKGAA